MSLFAELQRRNVLRVATAYVVASWLLIQVAETIFPLFGYDETPARLVVIILAVCFLPALVLAWAFELTPEGLKKEKDVDRSRSIASQTGKRLDRIIMIVLAIGIGYFALDKFLLSETREAAIAEQARQEGRDEALLDSYGTKSIAVLAFDDMSPDKDQEYLSDGVAEELLNLLTKVPELRVISRSSAFSYKGKDIRLRQIAEELGVSHILAGSVRKSGNDIRIAVQLIEARSETNLWSETYSRELGDIFAMQDEIGQSVVESLEVQLLEELPRVAETSPPAYELYLQAQSQFSQSNAQGMLAAESLLKRALEIDPDYAPAWSLLSQVYLSGSSVGAWEPSEAVQMARDSVESALRIDNTNADAHGVLGTLALRFDRDWEAAEQHLNRALELAPTNIAAIRRLAYYHRYHGRIAESNRLTEAAVSLDPMEGPNYWISDGVFYSGRRHEGIALYREAIEANPFGDRERAAMALALATMGDTDAALAELEQAPDNGHRLSVLVYVYETLGDTEKSDETMDALVALGNRWTFEIAEAHAIRGELDEAFDSLHRAIDRYDGSLGRTLYTPFMVDLRADPRFDAVVERLGLVNPIKL